MNSCILIIITKKKRRQDGWIDRPLYVTSRKIICLVCSPWFSLIDAFIEYNTSDNDSIVANMQLKYSLSVPETGISPGPIDEPW